MALTHKIIADQQSWVIRSSDVELAVTELGGHMAPVKFYRRSARSIQPYYINPWHGEGLDIAEPVLVPLRGDFFCMPFGGGSYRGQSHAAHGETAAAKWKLLDHQKRNGRVQLSLTMRTRVLPGRVIKNISLLDGHNVVYVQHVLEGFSAKMPLGHHATLAMPARPISVKISTSPIQFAMTNPAPPGDPGNGEYHSIAVNKRFADLARVPLNRTDPPYGDFASFPARKGFCDLLAVFNKPADQPAWTAATFQDDGFIWFSLKDARLLPTLMMWVENHGRHNTPWNGRNCCLGLEDVCAYFAMGLAPSLKKNELNKAGIATAVKLSPRRPTVINYIQGVVKAPRSFGKVKSLDFTKDRIVFTSTTGKEVSADVKHDFLQTGKL